MEKRKIKKFNLKKFLIIAGIILFFALLFYIIYNERTGTCGDGTLSKECSVNRPYFCENGILTEKAGVCGCPEILEKEEDSCISKYQNNSKKINLDYVLRGKKSEIDFVVYEGMHDYLGRLPFAIHDENGEESSRVDFKLRNINEEEQRELLLPLVIEIQNQAKKETEQVRIAVSLVQNIPFGSSEKKIVFRGTELNYSRYPYEVLYDMEGVCGEKSELMAFLLKELGYGVAIFYFPTENHEAIGIFCPAEKSFDKTDYCFTETSGPAVITDDELEYSGGIEIKTEPELMIISEGKSLPGNLYEYGDAEDLIKIKKDGKISFFESSRFEKLQRKYGLAKSYNL